ncbi:rna-directed dna polymerase from mobile element jockey-like [Pitangus sulphuratus]|nr:rna-directed dna polymerase from mobile element jockey-like [Pitangus sulphuratus]
MEKSIVPQGSVLGPVLLNIFITDNEVECTFSKSADDMKLNSVTDTREGRDAIHGDLDKLKKRTHENLMKFNKSMCKVLHLGGVYPIPDMSTDWESNSLKTALQRKTCGFLWMKSWT